MKRDNKLLAEGSFGQLLLRLSLPTVVVMLVMVVYNMADTYFIGQTGDPNKVAALGLCGPVFSILSGLGTLFGNGGGITVSLALGRKDEEEIRRICAFCAVASVALGLVLMTLVLLFPLPLTNLLGATEETRTYALDYLKIIALGAPIIMFNNSFGNIIRSDGAAVKAMFSNILGTVSNIVLDAVFIMGFHWDVRGAAIATVLGNILTTLYLVWYLRRQQPLFAPSLRALDLSGGLPGRVLSLGVPMAFSTLLMSVSHMIANRLMIAYGATALAAQGVAGRVSMLCTMLLMGLCMGLQPAVSYTYSSGQHKRLFSLLQKMSVFTFLLGTALAALCFVFRTQLIRLFIDNEAVIRDGQIMVLAGLSTAPIYGIYQLSQVFLQSTGKAGYATFTALLDKGLFYLPILFVMRRFFGMYGIAFTGAVTLVFSLIVCLALCLRWARGREFGAGAEGEDDSLTC